MHAHRPVIILSTVHGSPWRTPFAMTPHVDTARKASPGTGQWARFPSSEATQEVTSVRIQRLDPLSGAFANTPVTEGDPLQPVTAYYKTAPPTRCALPAGSRRRRQSAGGPATDWNRARRAPPPGPRPVPITLNGLDASHPRETPRNTRDAPGQRSGQNAHLPQTRKRPAS